MGKRAGALLGAALLLMPMAAQAQHGKPGSNVWIRSAEIYLLKGHEQSNPQDKTRFFNEALEQALNSTQKDPNNANGWRLAGMALAALGQIQRADTMLDKAEEIWPPYAEADDTVREQAWIESYNSAVVALRAQDTDGAIQHLQLADDIFQKRPAARMTLASLYLNKGDYDQAAKYYKGALEILNGPASKDLPADRAQQWQEDRTKVQDLLGQLYMATRKYDDAVAFFQQQAQANPNDASIKLSLARALALDGKEADAKALFIQMVNGTGLSDDQLVDAGVALFRAQDFATASSAFRKAAALNPLNHGALYNLAQSLLAQAQPIEQAREKAAATDRKPFAAQLGPFFTELKDVTGRFLALEPANAAALRLASATARGLADIAPDAKAEEAGKLSALSFLERADSLTFDVSNTSMSQTGDSTIVSGTITNRKLTVGDPARLKVDFLSKDGATLDTQSVTVPAPPKEQPADFKVTSTAKDVASWKYEVVR
jgi:tetratricopeptide (TPR) repeat protein